MGSLRQMPTDPAVCKALAELSVHLERLNDALPSPLLLKLNQILVSIIFYYFLLETAVKAWKVGRKMFRL